uniref:Tubulin alpha-2 chain protein n=1 Tax=Streptomyces antibioticus TaxID=1890 RepID=A0A1S5RMR4_STRAT|nr:tubulin alpha-2 chain protein [Streptomyces antibioticus]
MNQHVKNAFTGPGAIARIAGAAMLIGTLAVQHPHPVFNRLQRKDTFALLPNWRFFAPEPAVHDYHFFYRTLNTAGETSPWHAVDLIAARRAHQIFWFPGRRTEKAVFDICSEMLQTLDKGFSEVVRTPAYRVISAYLREQVRTEASGDVKGFQFALARATGHDTATSPETLFVSPYTPMDPASAPAHPRVRRPATARASRTPPDVLREKQA